jgi:hypothetical protein
MVQQTPPPPVAVPEPEAPAQPPVAAAPVAAAPAATPRAEPVAEPVASPQPVAEAPAPEAAVPVAPIAALPEAAAPSVATEPQATAADSGPVAPTGAIAALLLALGLGGGALFAARSRPRRTGHAEDRAYAQIPEPVVRADAPAERPTTRERIGTEELAPARTPPVAAAPAVQHSEPIGALPQTRTERDAMLNRMAAEAPSPENPFTSRKARLRRARLIIQRLEQEQGEAAAKPFDWRTYSPSTSHPTPATPQRVTA